jgi:hypothetical protein
MDGIVRRRAVCSAALQSPEPVRGIEMAWRETGPGRKLLSADGSQSGRDWIVASVMWLMRCRFPHPNQSQRLPVMRQGRSVSVDAGLGSAPQWLRAVPERPSRLFRYPKLRQQPALAAMRPLGRPSVSDRDGPEKAATRLSAEPILWPTDSGGTVVGSANPVKINWQV